MSEGTHLNQKKLEKEMELIYRGIKYKSNNLAVLNSTEKKQTIYQRKSLKPIRHSKFPVVKYCKQLFCSSKSAVCHPVKFWNRHKSQHIENCWKIDVVEQLDSCWKTTLYIEQVKSLPEKPLVELKYRGITYYR